LHHNGRAAGTLDTFSTGADIDGDDILMAMTFRRAAGIWAGLGLTAIVVGVASLSIGSLTIPPLHALSSALSAVLSAVSSAISFAGVQVGSLWGSIFASNTGATAGALDGTHSVAAINAINATSTINAATPDIAAEVVRTLRLPRTMAGFACGALLSLAGALLQILLRNPLADPYVLGVSGGAATFALAAMLLMWPVWAVDAASISGALVAILVILLVARRAFGRSMSSGAVGTAAATPSLLLAGVVLAAGWGAMITVMLSLAPDTQLRGMVFWLTGDLNGVTQAAPALISLVLALAVAVPMAPKLNILLRGEVLAHSLGVAAQPLRFRIIVVASLASAAAVTTAGTIGFVGLVVPHLIRLSFGNDQRMLLPAAALAGGTLTMAADLAARSVLAPVQLPVGALMALMGVPLFIWILLGRRHRA